MNKYNSHDVILNVKSVSFSYFKGINKTEVLNNISFDLNKGEMVACWSEWIMKIYIIKFNWFIGGIKVRKYLFK